MRASPVLQVEPVEGDKSSSPKSDKNSISLVIFYVSFLRFVVVASVEIYEIDCKLLGLWICWIQDSRDVELKIKNKIGLLVLVL